MSQRSSSDVERSAGDEMAQAWPFFVIVSLVMVGGYVTALISNQSLREPVHLALFTTLILMHGSLYWLSPRLTLVGRRLLAYCVVQGALTFAIGLLAPGHWLTLALYLALAGLITGALWPNLRAIAMAISLCFGLLALNLIMSWGLQEFVQFLPIVGLMLAFVFTYVVLFVRQVEARERAQTLLHDLEIAHRQL